MTEIERKALALVNEVRDERDLPSCGYVIDRTAPIHEALCRAIEQHEAFRQEVSEAVEMHCDAMDMFPQDTVLGRFIIAKPDPLVEVAEALRETYCATAADWSKALTAALAARGLKIVEDK